MRGDNNEFTSKPGPGTVSRGRVVVVVVVVVYSNILFEEGLPRNFANFGNQHEHRLAVRLMIGPSLEKLDVNSRMIQTWKR
jgi:hypothetical protein